MTDYRNTDYCDELQGVQDRKNNVVKMVKEDHPRAIDMHTYISINEGLYKIEFIRAYNGKCAYCGASIDIIAKEMFEIDHFIHKESKRFKGKASAGFIENLILSCHSCNHNKGDIELPDEDHKYIHPDGQGITNTFCRDSMYYIQISDKFKNNDSVNRFYKQLKLKSEIHRVDYLLMSLIGLQRKHKSNRGLCCDLGHAIDILRRKRNIM